MQFKLKDRIALGVLTGMLASPPSRIINRYEYNKGYTEVDYDQLAAGLFLPPKSAKAPKGRLLGVLVNQTLLSVMGIATTYLLSASGRDKALLKGAGLGTLFWVTIYGVSTRVGITSVKPKDPTSILLSFVDHAVLGALTGVIVARMGDNDMFPDAGKEQKPLLAGASLKLQSSYAERATQEMF